MRYSIIFYRCTFCVIYYLGFYVVFNTVQVISRQVVGRAEETSTYSLLGWEVGGESVTTLPSWPPVLSVTNIIFQFQCKIITQLNISNIE